MPLFLGGGLSSCFLSLCSFILQGWAMWGAPSCPLSPAPSDRDIGRWRNSYVTEPARILHLVLALSFFCSSWEAALRSHRPGDGRLLAFFMGRLCSGFHFPKYAWLCSHFLNKTRWSVLCCLNGVPNNFTDFRVQSPAGWHCGPTNWLCSCLISGRGNVFLILRTAVSL